MIKIKLDIEKIILIIFVAVFLFIGPGNLFEHKIKHDFPYGYFASDSFQHQTRAEAIKDSGNFRNEAPYISKSLENIVGWYPPLLHHLAVIISYIGGIEVYDSIYFSVFFFTIIGILVMYFIVKNFNKNIALLSLPFAIIVLIHPASVGFTWGHWPSLVSQSFLIAFFWSLMRIDLNKSYFFISAFLTSIIMTHTSEAIFAIIFTVLFFSIRLISKKFEKKDFFTMLIVFFIAFVVSFYYLIIFKYTLAKGEPYSFAVQPIWDGNPGFYIAGFGILLIAMIFGILYSLLKFKDIHASMIMAFSMLIGGFLNYIGFGLRSFQVRFFWPIYLAVFIGIGLFIPFKFLLRKWNLIYTLLLFSIFTLMLAGFFKVTYVPQYSYSSSRGIMDIYHWKALKWLSSNAELNAKIYFFYGDIYSQDALLRNSKRIHYQVDPDDFVKAINEHKIKRNYISELPGDSGALAVRESFFKIRDVSHDRPSQYFFGPQDICKFNYIVFDKYARQQDLAKYNLLIASEMVKKNFIKLVFENEVVVILKNNNIGDDCIEERSF